MASSVHSADSIHDNMDDSDLENIQRENTIKVDDKSTKVPKH